MPFLVLLAFLQHPPYTETKTGSRPLKGLLVTDLSDALPALSDVPRALEPRTLAVWRDFHSLPGVTRVCTACSCHIAHPLIGSLGWFWCSASASPPL